MSNQLRKLAEGSNFLAGGILIASALLKAASPAQAGTLMIAHGIPPWLSIALILFELTLAVLLITNIAGRAGHFLCIATFLCFLFFSAYQGIAGFESCGCFGAIKIQPWVMCAIDFLIVLVLVWSVLRSRPSRQIDARGRFLWPVIFCVVLGGTALGLWLNFRPRSLTEGDSIGIATGDTVIVEPNRWHGRELPITEYLSPMPNLSRGEWTILLYDHSCPDCRAAIPFYDEFAAQFQAGDANRQVLLIEVPPYGPIQQFSAAISARLANEINWFVRTPVEIVLTDGIVKSVSHDLPSIAARRCR